MSREILTGRVGKEVKFETRTSKKDGKEFEVADFTLFVSDPWSGDKNATEENAKSWNSFPKHIQVTGKRVAEVKELVESGKLTSGTLLTVLGKYRVSEFEKDGKKERRESIQMEKLDFTGQLEREHNAILLAYVKGDIDSIAKGLVDEFPSIDEAEEIDASTEYAIEQEQDISVER